jgi:hypothetical protein
MLLKPLLASTTSITMHKGHPARHPIDGLKQDQGGLSPDTTAVTHHGMVLQQGRYDGTDTASAVVRVPPTRYLVCDRHKQSCDCCWEHVLAPDVALP